MALNDTTTGGKDKVSDTFSGPQEVQFGEFRFNRRSLELWHDNVPVPLAPKPARILAALLAHPTRLLTREELYKVGWGDQFLSFDLALNSAIRHIRRALADTADDPSFIQTVPRRGYRFIAEVTVADPPAARGADPSRTRHRMFRTRWMALGGFAAVAGLVTVAWFGPHTPPTIEIAATRMLDGTLDQATGTILEQRIRSTVARQAGHDLVVIAPGAVVDQGGSPAEYLVRTNLYTATPGEPRFDVQVIRTSDQAIVWSGWFNPHCTRVSDPGEYIARNVTRVLLKRVT